MAGADDGRKGVTQARPTPALARRLRRIPRWRALFFAAICLLPLSPAASEATHRSTRARLLYGWWWGGIVVYDLELGVRVGRLTGPPTIPSGFVLGKTDAFVMNGQTVYDYRVGSLTASRTLPVSGSDLLIGETDGHPILQNKSKVSVKDMSGTTISAAPGVGAGSTTAFDSLRHRIATASTDRVQIWDTANGHLTDPRRIVAQADSLRFDANGDLIVSVSSPDLSVTATRYAFERHGSIRKVSVHAGRPDVYRLGITRVTVDSGCPARPRISWGTSSVTLEQKAERQIRAVVLDAGLGTVVATSVCVTAAAPHGLDGRILIYGNPAKLSRTIVSEPALSWIYLTYR